MSPHAYIKLRRLKQVRRALRRRSCAESLVKSIASAHGFWHLDYFARDYRARFGESPSETLASGNAESAKRSSAAEPGCASAIAGHLEANRANYG